MSAIRRVEPTRHLAALQDEVELPFVSIVIPCRNEAEFIRRCIDSVYAGTYARDRYEVLVVDGLSDDGTREELRELQGEYPSLRVLDNPARTTPHALNIGIRASRGEIIVRLDAHASVERDYVEQCVRALLASGADNVGGNMRTVPLEDTVVARAIATVLSHPMGVGGSTFRTNSTQPVWVDTVFGGCYPREVFEKVGLFNEGLRRGQDMEFNVRLRRAGGRILLVPQIVSYYYSRSSMPSFTRQNWNNGVWAILPFLHSDVPPVGPRHLVPMAFVSVVLALLLAAPFVPAAGWALAVVLGIYATVILAVAVIATLRRRLPPATVVVLPVAFANLHFVYGAGSVWGTLKLVAHWVSHRGRRVEAFP